MVLSPESAVNDAWLAWAVSWFAAAFWSDRAAKRPGFGAEALYRAVMLAGIALLFGLGLGSSRDSFKLWAVGGAAGWTLAGAAVLGFLFCWWARLHLGRLWSGWVTKKADHRIVDTGPYGIVRHPIYTGLMVSAFSTALIKGTAVALAGAAVITWSFWLKARLEEKFLGAELGEEAYGGYRRRVPMLIPFGPKAG
jgi:protein-S-isoprenylcysteine O-methyltransferase Ste14